MLLPAPPLPNTLSVVVFWWRNCLRSSSVTGCCVTVNRKGVNYLRICVRLRICFSSIAHSYAIHILSILTVIKAYQLI